MDGNVPLLAFHPPFSDGVSYAFVVHGLIFAAAMWRRASAKIKRAPAGLSEQTGAPLYADERFTLAA